MSCYGEEPVDLWNETWHTARTAKKCRARGCSLGIRSGDRYRKTFLVFEGRGQSWNHCARCAAIYDAISKELNRRRANGETEDNSIDEGLDCGHTWQENFGEPPPDVAALAFMTADEAQALAARGVTA